MEKNKVTTYLLYAVGEIALVVIGILIAVSIDNWNENQKKLNKEYEFLINIKNELALDTIDFKWNYNIHNTFLSEEKKLYRLLQGDESIHPNSIDYTMALGWSIGVAFHTTSYNNLLNQENDLIQNKDLRKKIFSQYDYFYNTLKLVEHDIEFYQIYLSKEVIFKKHFVIGNEFQDVLQSGGGSDDYWEDTFHVEAIVPKDIEKMRNDEELAFVLSRAILKRSVKFSLYKENLDRIRNIIKDIEQEINNRFK